MRKVELFLTYDGESDPAEVRACFERYREYLGASAERFPHGAYEYATAPWHYQTSDPRCPHDAWLQRFHLLEEYPFKESDENSIEITLLGAFHDGNIILRYTNVHMYALNKDPDPDGPKEGHGDWLVDELSLTDENVVVHTIDWVTGARWQIWCDDLDYEWKPFADTTSGQ